MIPEIISNLIKAYFHDLQRCSTLPDFTTACHCMYIWHNGRMYHLPISFTMATEVIIKASKWVVGSERLTSGVCLPPTRAYMDGMTTITASASCTRCLLAKLHQNITGARIQSKPSNSRSTSVIRGNLLRQRFFINQEPIPTVLEKPIKSLARCCLASKTFGALVQNLYGECMEWKQVGQIFSFELPMMSSLPPKTSTRRREEPSCPLCSTPATLLHILTG